MITISEVRIKLEVNNKERLLAFCSITIGGCFVVRDLKLISGKNGLFVAMPSRKLADHCVVCGVKNHLRARYCQCCGNRLGENRFSTAADGHADLHRDICHPVSRECREVIQAAVVAAYREEIERAKSPGYVCTYDGDGGPDDLLGLYPRS